ncbi:MAG TPA: transcription-repair coupling factor [Bacteroidales bacterium]|nr:transcription-repair coupling factor [Bacteroidales bacterium]
MQSDSLISELLQKYKSHQSTGLVINELESPKSVRLRLKGLAGSSVAIVNAALSQTLQRVTMVVLNDKEEAAYFFSDLSTLLPADSIHFFPSSYKRAVQFEQILPDALIQRTDTQKALLSLTANSSDWAIIVTYPEALAEKVVTIDHFEKNTISIAVGESISQEFLVDFLISIGFERTDFVYEPGQFSVRGGIVDVFSFSSALPYRIDFFGDEVESIRTFEVDTQLSSRKFDSVTIIPNLQTKNEDSVRQVITELLPKDAIVWIRDSEIIVSQMDTTFEAAENEHDFAAGAAFVETIQQYAIVEFGLKSQFKPHVLIDFETSPQPAFHKNFELLAQHITENAEKGYTTFILAENPAQHKRLESILQNINPNVKFTPINLALSQGYIDHGLGWCIYTDHQIFDRYQKYKLKNELSKSDSLSMKELASLKPGDYVVHVDHGIGIFGGMVKTNVNGNVQEAVRLTYKDGDMLLVNIHALHRISKYRGSEAEMPKLYKLGSGAWQKLKLNTKRKVKDIAKELIALYAKRKSEKGLAFSADTYLQEELEASFIYEDTPDQQKATQAVKEDMQNTIPMDRLVCGDVGFGKTEIAIRAAFKAVTDSKQVAVLVPTTILALQHYQTFMQRLTSFPCTVEYISRMKSPKAQKDILKRLSEGKVDIIIGTHALLRSTVKFKDLGLMIVDEEQKFGVAAKEKLKNLRVNVDTLTLTATPIPRTLQFSLMGARDLSIINTPPPNRHPIATELHTFNTEIIKEAIEYEVNRGGQVFFVHNRVQNIAEVQQMILKLCNHVTATIAHGQMESAKLEKTMLDFISGDYDVLVSTTIIESGLDIPNANTIIINNAHMFGLSDLHQLRGRVGRSNKKAFCYLLAPPLEGLTPEARRRLKAIEEFSELGSGFSIAMQDLDIRGAGNMLGAEQSGFIADIGFETYHKILDEAMQELRDEEFTEVLTDGEQPKPNEWKPSNVDCHVETDFELLFPDSYVSSVPERMRLYRELDSIMLPQELDTFEAKLKDRFGELPIQAEELLSVVELRWMAQSLGIEKIIIRNQQFIGYFIANQISAFYRSSTFANIISFIQHNPKKFQLKEQRNKLTLLAKGVKNMDDALVLIKYLYESTR